MKIRPIQNRVLVRRDKNEEKTPGGIVIPDNAKEKVTRGEVIAVGPGKFEYGKFWEPMVKTGDKVLFGKYSGTEVRTVTVDGEDLLVMSEDDIYGVIED